MNGNIDVKFDVNNYSGDSVDNQLKVDQKPSSFAEDKTLWKPAKDKSETYVIRFVPDVYTKINFIETYYHGINHFPGTEKKFLGGYCSNMKNKNSCPACAYGWPMKNSKIEALMDKAKDGGWIPQRKWVSNILVINDPNKPENNGKVFKFEYGIQVMNKILKRNNPDSAQKNDPRFKQYNPFDILKGGDFILSVIVKKMTKNGKEIFQPNYDGSDFNNAVSAIANDNAEIEKIMLQTYNLQEHIDNLNYLTPERIRSEVGYILDMGNGVDTFKATPPNHTVSDTPPWEKSATVPTTGGVETTASAVVTDKEQGTMTDKEKEFIDSL